jgi:hypothetical protein
MMTTNPSITNSFNEVFCAELEYHLTKNLRNTAITKFNILWCDGILMPDENQLTKAHLEAFKSIITTAFIGVDGQSKYTMTIHLGSCALNQCIQSLSLKDCLPNDTSANWINIDTSNKCINLQLN